MRTAGRSGSLLSWSDFTGGMKKMRKQLTVIAGTAVCAAFAISAEGTAPFTVDFSREVGTIRRLNGLCGLPPIAGGRSHRVVAELVGRLEIPYFRTHDDALAANPGYALVDVSRIFPLFHADADDPRNYIFEPTDDYFRPIVETGVPIEFRLGESIEHSKRQYRVNPPPDPEKWADICCHIIRHYNCGWANGFRWNIRRWAIWEEPDTNPQLLTGGSDPFVETYLCMYATAVRKIKAEFPGLHVSGPQGVNSRHLDVFVRYCATNGLPIDVYGVTHYDRSSDGYVSLIRRIRKTLDENGFQKTKIALSEWHWGPQGWDSWTGAANNSRIRQAYREDVRGWNACAFTAEMLMRMQDEPVDYMYFYALKSDSFGLVDRGNAILPPYWAMYAFGQLARGEARIAAIANPKAGWWMLASKERNSGLGRVLVSALRADGQPELTLLGGVTPVSVKVADASSSMEEVPGWSWNAERKSLYLPRNAGDSAVWLIEVK